MDLDDDCSKFSVKNRNHVLSQLESKGYISAVSVSPPSRPRLGAEDVVCSRSGRQSSYKWCCDGKSYGRSVVIPPQSTHIHLLSGHPFPVNRDSPTLSERVRQQQKGGIARPHACCKGARVLFVRPLLPRCALQLMPLMPRSIVLDAVDDPQSPPRSQHDREEARLLSLQEVFGARHAAPIRVLAFVAAPAGRSPMAV